MKKYKTEEGQIQE